MCHASVTTEITAAVDVRILTERASAQSISASTLWLVPHGFNMKTCGFTVQSDKVEVVSDCKIKCFTSATVVVDFSLGG